MTRVVVLCAFEVPATALGIDGLPVVVVPEAGAWHHDNKNEKKLHFWVLHIDGCI